MVSSNYIVNKNVESSTAHYICMFGDTHSHIHKQVFFNINIHVIIHMNIHICIHVNIHISIYTETYAYICAYT